MTSSTPTQEDNSPENQTPARAGIVVIQEFVRQLPNQPGVYRMTDHVGDVLYVGKARNLKKRVSSYAKMGGHSNRIARMIGLTHSMEFVTTHTETEALLLEANLIKRLRPRFNVLLRDDKSFPYIVVTKDHPAPGIFKHRGARRKDRDYFGPFASAGAVDRTINAMQRAFLIRTCSDQVFETRSRPCLLHQIKRCSAPCTGEVSQSEYGKLLNEAERFLSGKSSDIQASLSRQMQDAADQMDFERAAIYRDRLAALSQVQTHQGINPQTIQEADVFAVEQKEGINCIQVFFFRTGQNWGNRAYFPKADPSLEPGEVLSAFLAQFYDDKPCPRNILLSHEIEECELLAEALASRAEHRISINIPKRGEKHELVVHAANNAREALGRKLAETSSQTLLLDGLREAFDLDFVPERIEVYDNSHIMGTNAVGGMIVAGPEGFMKGHYRKFNIKSDAITPGDDYAMMREVLSRRFTRLIQEVGIDDKRARDAQRREAFKAAQEGSRPESDMDKNPAEFPQWPDLMLIDGGIGQLNAVRKVMEELGIFGVVPIVGIAKGVDRDAGREKFFMPGREAFMLRERDRVLYFVQRLRDEAHRFAIGTHRAKRKKEMVKNPLDEVPGIGPSRKRALLHHFGTAKAVSRAALVDLTAVEGISMQMAQTIYDHFHEG